MGAVYQFNTLKRVFKRLISEDWFCCETIWDKSAPLKQLFRLIFKYGLSHWGLVPAHAGHITVAASEETVLSFSVSLFRVKCRAVVRVPRGKLDLESIWRFRPQVHLRHWAVEGWSQVCGGRESLPPLRLSSCLHLHNSVDSVLRLKSRLEVTGNLPKFCYSCRQECLVVIAQSVHDIVDHTAVA